MGSTQANEEMDTRCNLRFPSSPDVDFRYITTKVPQEEHIVVTLQEHSSKKVWRGIIDDKDFSNVSATTIQAILAGKEHQDDQLPTLLSPPSTMEAVEGTKDLQLIQFDCVRDSSDQWALVYGWRRARGQILFDTTVQIQLEPIDQLSIKELLLIIIILWELLDDVERWKIRALQAEMTTLEQGKTIAQINKSNQKLTAEVNGLRAKAVEANERLEFRDRAITTLRQQYTVLSKTISKLELVNSTLVEANEHLQRQLAAAKGKPSQPRTQTNQNEIPPDDTDDDTATQLCGKHAHDV